MEESQSSDWITDNVCTEQSVVLRNLTQSYNHSAVSIESDNTITITATPLSEARMEINYRIPL